jgi:hypothetical protein
MIGFVNQPPMESRIVYAMTDDGLRLPVIDVTQPAFAVAATDAELSVLSDQFVRESRARQRVPAVIQRLLLKLLLRRSRIGRGLLASSGAFLKGMDTYMLKLGPNNLGSYAEPMDRRVAASFPAFATRLRLQDMARLLADGLSSTLAADSEQPLCLLNIAGGPAADSLNALILIQAEHPGWLADRKIVVAVLDFDAAGPAFGARAVDALGAPGAPLSGLEIDFRFIKYDWREASGLGHVLEQLRADKTVCAISSEGGLFEYGSDEEITTNLERLHLGTPPGAIVVGSVTRDDDPARLARAEGRVLTRLRTIGAFRGLAQQAGWAVERVLERPFSYNVGLVKA